MKDLLSKEHYCYKIYNEKQWLPPSIDNPLYGLPPPHPQWGSNYEKLWNCICAYSNKIKVIL